MGFRKNVNLVILVGDVMEFMALRAAIVDRTKKVEMNGQEEIEVPFSI